MLRRILIVAGARPNFMKIAPLLREFKTKQKYNVKLIHTGQHYDFTMSKVFFRNLRIPRPNYYLNVGSGTHAQQTADIMYAFEKVMNKERPELVIVVGDVNSTIACSLVAAKLHCPVAHVEAGLRSFDRSMPEEINRRVTDALSDYLFVSEKSGVINLKHEGIPDGKVFFVGNVMIDTLISNLSAINQTSRLRGICMRGNKYCVVTLHRPQNVDSKQSLTEILKIFKSVSAKVSIVWPMHPRAKKMLIKFRLLKNFMAISNLVLLDPLGYIDFISLVKSAVFVLTDSGGIQEETTYLRVPCLTMRENTERPCTIMEGSNILVGRRKRVIINMVNKIIKGAWKKSSIPQLWDGKASKRIVDILARELHG